MKQLLRYDYLCHEMLLIHCHFALVLEKNKWFYMQVYDVSSFMDDHPGGDEVLISATGKISHSLSLGKHRKPDFEYFVYSGLNENSVWNFCRERCNK